MKAIIPQPVHESYKRHRKQLVWQIILPIVLTSLLIVALIVLINIATFRDGGDVGRWAAISTIWIVVPIMLGLLIVLALVGGLVYLMMKLLNVTPTYTSLAQDYVYLAEGYIKRATEAIVKPVLQINGILASVIAFFEKMRS
jgi:energy-coupling factor transporter transmembrane protein EcfT